LDGIELQICQLITDTPIHFPEKNINAYIISPTILNTMQVDHFVKLEGLQITNYEHARFSDEIWNSYFASFYCSIIPVFARFILKT